MSDWRHGCSADGERSYGCRAEFMAPKLNFAGGELGGYYQRHSGYRKLILESRIRVCLSVQLSNARSK